MIYILVLILMMVFTIFCFRWYIHPGTHKRFMDQLKDSKLSHCAMICGEKSQIDKIYVNEKWKS
jgi:hypothetical protein